LAVTGTEKTFAQFFVKGGNTLDFQTTLSSLIDKDLIISLYRNDTLVASAATERRDSFRTIDFRDKPVKDSTYTLKIRAEKNTPPRGLTIEPRALSWGFRTYGSNHAYNTEVPPGFT